MPGQAKGGVERASAPALGSGVTVGVLVRPGAGIVLGVTGLLAIGPAPPVTAAGWLGWIVAALAAGALAGPRGGVPAAWPGWGTVLAFALATAVGGALDDRPWWWAALAVGAVLFVGSFLVGTAIGTGQPLDRPVPSAARGAWVALGPTRWPCALTLAAATVWMAGSADYGFIVGAREYLAATPAQAGCATPRSQFGWRYEAINYDIADDDALLAANPNPRDCATQGAPAGRDLVSDDGVPLAGWYIPAASGAGAAAPTVVLVHGGKTNKSGMLEYAPAFHASYNLVLFDQRNSGRSGAGNSTGGLHERLDVRAIVDWLERTKGSAEIVLMGNSNGAAAALAEAVSDRRVDALILDSMHASLEQQMGNIIETEHGLPAWPSAWALAAGAGFLLGEDVSTVDPMREIRRVGDRPVLLTHGLRDRINPPAEALEPNLHAALEAGVASEVRTCPTAGHGMVAHECPGAFAGWVNEFLARALAG